jgi:hypothetical protein
MSSSASLNQTIYSHYTKYTCILDTKLSHDLQKMMAAFFSTTGARFAPRLKINVCHSKGRDIEIWCIDTAVTSEKLAPQELERVISALSNTTIELVPCPDDEWARFVSSH